MLKLTRKLFALQPDIRYAEFHEQALFNHILGSMDPSDGATCYMVPVGRGVRREYADMQRSFTCCVGTGMESHSLHGFGIYYEAGSRLWVNLYAPSRRRGTSAGATIKMQTSFPEGDTATLRIDIKAPKALTLSLRRPAWAGDGFALQVNGERAAVESKPGSYIDLTRTWKSGDTVTIRLPRTLRLARLPDNPKRAAVVWGPLVLAGDLGPQPRREADGDGDGPPTATTNSPVIVTNRPVSEWLTPVAGQPDTFRTTGVGPEVTLAPFYDASPDLHRLLGCVDPGRKYRASRGTRGGTRTHPSARGSHASRFAAGDATVEKAHNQQGDATSIVRTDGRAGRRAAKWFSYDIPLSGGAERDGHHLQPRQSARAKLRSAR